MINCLKVSVITVAFLVCYGFYFGLFKSFNESVTVVPLSEAYLLWKEGDTLFIDTREPEEFAEGHIPGSINITLREFIRGLTEQQQNLLRQKKYILPYCVKNFRGTEVAHVLSRSGFKNVIVTKPSGYSGWEKAEYPTTD